MKQPVRILQYGLGPIGLETVRTILRKEKTGQLLLVGAIDTDPEKAGKNLFDLLEETGERRREIIVSDRAEETLEQARPDVVLHTTSSFLPAVIDQIAACARAGAHVISSTEELFFPFVQHPELTARLHAQALEHRVVVTGTGVNPGFVMDVLALTSTGVCTQVDSITVTRIVDAGKRRLPLQKKVGAGLRVEDFYERKASGTFGHIGLRESLDCLAGGLGWKLERIDEELSPVIAEREVRTPYLTVYRGQVAGIRHTIAGFAGASRLLSLELQMYVGAESSFDAINVVGTPPVELIIKGGVFGDTATVAMLVNTVPLVLRAQPGLRSASELGIPCAFATR